jgi:hypothetical protein
MSTPKPGTRERDAEDAGHCIRVGTETGAPLIPRCCANPHPVLGGIIEYIGLTGRTQELYCRACRGVIAQLTWNVEMS